MKTLTLGLVLTLAGTGAAFGMMGFPERGIDDAEITMVYARNLAEGVGYRYTPGYERVEGSTSLLWTLLCTLPFLAGCSSMAPHFLLGILLTGGAVALALVVARVSSGGPGAWLAGGCLLASPGFFVWSTTTLMDVALWSACLTAAVACWAIRDSSPRLQLVATPLVVFARPEGFAIAPLFALLDGGRLRRSGPSAGGASSGPKSRPWRLAFIVIAMMGLSTGARLWYFGVPLPNTYYAKVGSDFAHTFVEGSKYLAHFLLSTPVALIGFLASVRGLLRDGRLLLRNPVHSLERAVFLRLATVTTVLAGVGLRLVEGGDHFAGYRALQPFVPLLAATIGAEFGAELRALGKKPLLTIAALVGILALSASEWVHFENGPADSLRGEFTLAIQQRSIGRRLTKRLGTVGVLPSIGVIAAGGIAFEYQGRILDLMGLNWGRMAHASRDRKGFAGHAAFDPKTFWAEAPVFVTPELDDRRLEDACDAYLRETDALIFRGLLSSARFRTEYVGFILDPGANPIRAFARRDWLASHSVPGSRILDWPPDAATRPDCTAHRAHAGGGLRNDTMPAH